MLGSEIIRDLLLHHGPSLSERIAERLLSGGIRQDGAPPLLHNRSEEEQRSSSTPPPEDSQLPHSIPAPPVTYKLPGRGSKHLRSANLRQSTWLSRQSR